MNNEKDLLSEAAKHLNVCPTTIRLWCDGGKNNGKIVESRDNCFSYKKYTSRSL